MKLDPVIQTEVSQKEKNKYILMHIYEMQTNVSDEPVCRAGMEGRPVDTMG